MKNDRNNLKTVFILAIIFACLILSLRCLENTHTESRPLHGKPVAEKDSVISGRFWYDRYSTNSEGHKDYAIAISKSDSQIEILAAIHANTTIRCGYSPPRLGHYYQGPGSVHEALQRLNNSNLRATVTFAQVEGVRVVQMMKITQDC